MRVFEHPVEVASLTDAAGSYVLEFHLARPVTITAGRLGSVRLGPGRVRYYGSARGPGGVRSRVARHLRGAPRPHWHIDGLTARVPVTRVAVSLSHSECELVERDLRSGRWRVAVAGFGSSDCRTCPAHLLVRGP